MIQQTMNTAQVEIVNMMSFIQTPESLASLKKVIAQYFEHQLQEEVDRLWDNGTLTHDRINGFRTLHERTPCR